MNTHEFILKNWFTSVRDPRSNNKSYLPNKYMTPCADGIFQNFYYWDTYFINIGLLADGDIEMVRNNLNIMKYFVDKYGFIPNADHLIYGSQPPLFTRGIFDLYTVTKDIKDIKKYIESAILEMTFWDKKRETNIPGLSQYKCGFPENYCIDNYQYFHDRVGGYNETELSLNKVEMTQNAYAIAESGWDMNSRFFAKGNRFSSLKFAQIDLNSILYDAESKISIMLKILGDEKRSKLFKQKASNRKELIDKYLLTKDGIYLDYNFIDNEHSSLLSVASIYPYALGVSDDKNGCLKVFNALKEKHGVVSSVKHNGLLMQWDYPNMWPPVVYLMYLALINVGCKKEASWLRKEYMFTIDEVFKDTGRLWEKYNPITVKVSYHPEYETPTMLGWTAGVYEFFYMAGETDE